MTNDEIQSAVAYNRRQGYCPSDVERIQRIVGASSDGKWGPKTARAVALWQDEHGLKPDGKVGPETYERVTVDDFEPVPALPEGRVVQIGCGLAAYDQEGFPGKSAEDALQIQFDNAVAEGATEIRYWSTEWLIPAQLSHGGNKGNAYAGAWLESATKPEGLVLGAWVDDPVHDVRKTAFVEHLVRMGLNRATLMLNRSNTRHGDVPWHLRYEREDLEFITRLFLAHGVELAATTWPRPSRAQIDAMLEDMAWILPVMQSHIFEVDTEGNWDPEFLEGFATMKEASVYLAEGMRRVVGDDGKIELTTFTYHRENSKRAVLAPLMDQLLPQAYGVRWRRQKGREVEVGWNDRLGPAKHTAFAMNRARLAAAA